MWAWSYYSSIQFDIQHWIEVSAECEIPVELTPSPLHPVADLLTGRLRGPQHLSGDFKRKKDL